MSCAELVSHLTIPVRTLDFGLLSPVAAWVPGGSEAYYHLWVSPSDVWRGTIYHRLDLRCRGGQDDLLSGEPAPLLSGLDAIITGPSAWCNAALAAGERPRVACFARDFALLAASCVATAVHLATRQAAESFTRWQPMDLKAATCLGSTIQVGSDLSRNGNAADVDVLEVGPVRSRTQVGKDLIWEAMVLGAWSVAPSAKRPRRNGDRWRQCVVYRSTARCREFSRRFVSSACQPLMVSRAQIDAIEGTALGT